MTRAITVVGAGPAGAVVATYLARAGHDVTVYELRPDLRQTNIDAGRSINLALATRGIAVLEALELMDDVGPLLIPARGRMIHDLDGAQSLQPYGSRPHEVIHSVGRSALNAVLLDAAEAAGAHIHFGQRCSGGDLDEGRLTFIDQAAGTEYSVAADVIVGADGFSSPVRTLITQAVGGTATVEPLAHRYNEITLPAGPNGDFQFDPNALHIWPRGDYMLIALADPDGTFTCTYFGPTEGGEASFAALDTPPAIDALFARDFGDFAALVPDLAEQFLDNPDGSLGTLRVDGWHHTDRAVVIGDAAHAIVPFHGQGMNAALESAAVLVDTMARHADWSVAFAEFERTRKPDADAIADMAVENYMEMRSSVRDAGYLLRRELALELERRWPERFTPRYALVMFTTIPYADARDIAVRQQAVLDDLTTGVDRIEDVDFDRAERLVAALSNPGQVM